jgi:LacI family transcriptional regulator
VVPDAGLAAVSLFACALFTGSALAAVAQALQDHGFPDDPSRLVVCPSWTEAAGAAALTALLDSGVDFTAVLAGNDLLALGCYDVLAARGLSCPGDVSVVGFNDTPFMDKLSPPLTTVRIPHYELGAEAARLLLTEIQEPDRHDPTTPRHPATHPDPGNPRSRR